MPPVTDPGILQQLNSQPAQPRPAPTNIPQVNRAPGVIRGPERAPTPVTPVQQQNIDIQNERLRLQQQGNPGVGFRIGADGNAEYIPGGPADPNTAQQGNQGNSVPQGAANRAQADIGAFTSLSRVLGNFNDDYAGNTLTGDLENAAQALIGTGTPGQSEWWADFRTLDNQIRNDLFGATLTPSEQRAYSQTSISPRMTPEKIRENLTRRVEVVRGALQRTRDFYLANGYREDAVNALFQPLLQSEYAEQQANRPQDMTGPISRRGSPAAAFPDGPQGGGTGGGGPNGGVTVQDMYPQGAQLGMDAPGDAAVSGGNILQELGISPEQERQMVGAFNAAARTRRNSFTTQDARAIFEGAGLPIPDDAELAAAVQAVRSGRPVVGYDTNQLEADRQSELEAINREAGRTDLGIGALGVQGAAQGLGDELAGADAAFSAAGNLDNPFAAYVDTRDATRLALEQARDRTGGMGTAAEVLGALGTGGVRAAPAAMRAARPVAAAAREGAIFGGAAGFGYGEGAGGSIGGAAVGAATGAALGAGVQRGVQAVSAARAPGVAARAAARDRQGVVGREVVQAGQREGVRVLTSDVNPPTTQIGNLARATGERIPYAGTGGQRAAQQSERVGVARAIAEEYGVTGTDDFVGAVSADLNRTRGRILSGLTNRKDRIIDGVQGAVDAPLAVRAIDEQIARLNGINNTAFAPVVQQLQNFRTVLTSGKSLRQIEGNRRLLGDMFSDPNLANVRGDGQKALNAIYGPLREDMANFVRANAGEGAANALRNTNERLATMVGELEATNFRRALGTADTTPENVARLLFSKNESDVRRLAENLSPQGRSNAQSAIIYRAIESAGDIDAVAGLSPQKFANAIERYSRNIGVVFSKEDSLRLQGVQRLLQATQRASEAAAMPLTGVQNAVPIAAVALTDVLGSGGAALTTGAIGGLLARVYESPAMRNRLIGLARSQPGSPQERRTVENIIRTASSQSGWQQSILRAVNDNAGNATRIAAEDEKAQQ